jgi:hypothetical protein
MTEELSLQPQTAAEQVSAPVSASASAVQITPQAQPVQGNWFHRNRWFTKEPVTYTGYQFVRAALASIPYGFGMAGVRHLFAWGEIKGLDAGISDAGKALLKLNPSGRSINAIDKLATTDRALYETMVKPGTKALIGRNFARFASSPFQTAAQIGVAFTMYRFVGGIVKTVRDKIMDEKNTAADTNRETGNIFDTIVKTAKTNWPAESTGTPWAALTLGFASANYVQSAAAKPQRKLLENGIKETRLGAIKRTFTAPHSKLAHQAGVFTIAYSIFFEIAERLFKDTQIRRGNWKGHDNSLVNSKSDTIVGVPPTEEGQKENPAEKPQVGFMTNDPSLGRLAFRRLLPVAVGITGYAVMKRIGYILAGGQMEAVTEEVIKGGFKKNAESLLTNSWREGAATSMFFTLWMATDAWGTWYDKFFKNLQHPTGEQKPVTPHQEQKYGELLGRINAHDRGTAMALRA